MEEQALDLSGHELYKLLNEPMPPLKKIEDALAKVEPSLISELIEYEPVTVYILDYYFRLFPPEIGGRIISDPQLKMSILVELFNYQLVRYYRVNLEDTQYDEDYASLMQSYWKKINRERLMELFKVLITGGDSNKVSAIMILENMDMEDLKFLKKDQTDIMLPFFKSLEQDFTGIISDNLDLYDFIYNLALEAKDEDYIHLLDRYTNLAVQLRIAQNFLSEALVNLDENGKIGFQKLVSMLNEIPPDFLGLTLQLMQRKGLIDESTLNSLQAIQKENGLEAFQGKSGGVGTDHLMLRPLGGVAAL